MSPAQCKRVDITSLRTTLGVLSAARLYSNFLSAPMLRRKGQRTSGGMELCSKLIERALQLLREGGQPLVFSEAPRPTCLPRMVRKDGRSKKGVRH